MTRITFTLFLIYLICSFEIVLQQTGSSKFNNFFVPFFFSFIFFLINISSCKVATQRIDNGTIKEPHRNHYKESEPQFHTIHLFILNPLLPHTRYDCLHLVPWTRKRGLLSGEKSCELQNSCFYSWFVTIGVFFFLSPTQIKSSREISHINICIDSKETARRQRCLGNIQSSPQLLERWRLNSAALWTDTHSNFFYFVSVVLLIHHI